MIVTKHARKKIRKRYGVNADPDALMDRPRAEGLVHRNTSGKLAKYLYRMFNERAQGKQLMEGVEVYAWDGYAWVFVLNKLVTVGTIPDEAKKSARAQKVGSA